MHMLIEYLVTDSVTGHVFLAGVNAGRTTAEPLTEQGIEACMRDVLERVEMYVRLEQINYQGKGDVTICVQPAQSSTVIPAYRRARGSWTTIEWKRMNERLNEILEGVS